MIDMQGFVDYINKGFWNIDDMEDILPLYMEQRTLYEQVSLRKTVQGGITDAKEAGLKKEYQTINKFIKDAVDENPPLPTENLATYSNRVCSIALKVAKEALEDNYVEKVVIQDISDIFTQYMKVKDMENTFWVAKIVNEPKSFLLNTNVKDVVNNPAISRELKIHMLITITNQLFSNLESFEKNFDKIYDLLEALSKYQIQIPIPIESAFRYMHDMKWSVNIMLARWLEFTCFICEISCEDFFGQHQEIVNYLTQLILLVKDSKRDLVDFEIDIHTLCDWKILSKEFYYQCFSRQIE
jgi:hypothetical protein